MPGRGATRPGKPGLPAATVVREHPEQSDVRERAREESDRRDREQRLGLRARGTILLEQRVKPGVDLCVERACTLVADVELCNVLPEPSELARVEAVRLDEIPVLVGQWERSRRLQQACVIVG